MGMGKGSDPPTPPDPYATANAQAQLNKDTAGYNQKINMVDQFTPAGSLVYNQNPTDPERWTSTVTLSPEQQKAWDLQQQVGSSLSQTALDATSQIQKSLGTPLDFSKAPKMPSTLNLKSFDAAGLPKGPATLDLSSLGAMPEGLDYSSLGALPNAPNVGAMPTWNEDARKQAEDALYGLHTARLDPQYQLERQNLENQLINKGMQVGTPQYNLALEEFERNKQLAYDQARKEAISGAVDYGTGMYNTELEGWKTALASALGIRATGAGELEKTLASLMGIRSQGMEELLGKAGVEEDYANRALQTATTGANVNLAQEQAKAAQAAAARQQAITEQTYLRNLPLNEVSTLLGTGQISMPSFGPPPTTNVANTDLGGMVYNSAKLAQDQWAQQQAQKNAILGGLFGLGGSALSGWSSNWGA